MRLVFSIFIFLSALPASAGPKLTVDFCRVINDWRAGAFTFQELCDRHEGNFCLGINSEGQALCRAGGGRFCADVTSTGQAICRAGEGRFCSSVKSLAQGICILLDGERCFQRPDTEDNLWTKKLEIACDTGAKFIGAPAKTTVIIVPGNIKRENFDSTLQFQ